MVINKPSNSRPAYCRNIIDGLSRVAVNMTIPIRSCAGKGPSENSVAVEWQ
jgi:hypothetical protein